MQQLADKTGTVLLAQFFLSALLLLLLLLLPAAPAAPVGSWCSCTLLAKSLCYCFPKENKKGSKDHQRWKKRLWTTIPPQSNSQWDWRRQRRKISSFGCSSGQAKSEGFESNNLDRRRRRYDVWNFLWVGKPGTRACWKPFCRWCGHGTQSARKSDYFSKCKQGTAKQCKAMQSTATQNTSQNAMQSKA